MNAPTSLGTFPSISVLQGLSSVNGRIIDNPSAVRRGRDGVTTTNTVVYTYEATSPTLMSTNIETVEL